MTPKRYACGRCGKEFTANTNHFGPIFTGCGEHDFTRSECIEPEAVLLNMAKQQENSDDRNS